MYKLTVMHDTTPVYDTVHNALPEGEIYFHTHQQLWKDTILLGTIYIDKNYARLIIDNHEAINIPRREFQRLFMTDAPIVQMLFAAKEVASVRMMFKKDEHYHKNNRIRVTRLYQHSEDDTNQFYADVLYTLKK